MGPSVSPQARCDCCGLLPLVHSVARAIEVTYAVICTAPPVQAKPQSEAGQARDDLEEVLRQALRPSQVQATGEEDHQHVGGRGGELASHFTPRLSRHTAALATALLTST